MTSNTDISIKDIVTDDKYGDQVIIVHMSRKDYDILRDMIAKQKALNWVGRWFKQVGFVAAAGIISMLLLWDNIVKFFHIGK